MNKTFIYIYNIFFLLIIISLKSYCQPKENYKENKEIIILNYDNLENWAAHPWKKDNADSIPQDLINKEIIDSVADVFFIHPTTYTQKEFIEWNADINNKELNENTDKTTILYQASVFNKRCRIFAPRYRQAHINVFYINEDLASVYFDIAYNDIKNAFEYYLEHYNNGRPIIIASHSQGTKHAGRLLKEFFENKQLNKQLICGYIIGMPIPEKYFSNLPPCSDEKQTGCFVGWRTYKKGYIPEFIKNEKFKSIVVNPLTWKINEDQVSIKLNKGGVLKNFNKIVPKVVDAKINGNILWSCKPDVFGKMFFTAKNFHIGDINLFYMNIRENVDVRIKSFMENYKP
jgi:hypothetical protein